MALGVAVSSVVGNCIGARAPMRRGVRRIGACGAVHAEPGHQGAQLGKKVVGKMPNRASENGVLLECTSIATFWGFVREAGTLFFRGPGCTWENSSLTSGFGILKFADVFVFGGSFTSVWPISVSFPRGDVYRLDIGTLGEPQTFIPLGLPFSPHTVT